MDKRIFVHDDLKKCVVCGDDLPESTSMSMICAHHDLVIPVLKTTKKVCQKCGAFHVLTPPGVDTNEALETLAEKARNEWDGIEDGEVNTPCR